MSKHSLSTNMTPPKKAKQAKLSPKDNATQYKIYCDLDGVLCDFDAGFRKISGKSTKQVAMGHMWSMVAGADSFYEHLPWMPDGKELWNSISHLNPDILTGVPRHYSSRNEKAAWCQRELGVETNHVDMAGYKRKHFNMNGNERQEGVVNVITCWSRNKHRESGFQRVLIDDRESLQRDWEMQGGIFIHHTSTRQTLKVLRERGILSVTESGTADKAEETKEKESEQPSSMHNMYGYGYEEYPDTP